MPRPAAVVRQFLKDMGEAGGFIQIGQNARVLLGYKTENKWVLFVLGFISRASIPIASPCGLLLGCFSAINALSRGQQRREQAHRI